MAANGLFGFDGGAGIAKTGIPAPAACPAIGCDVTGAEPPPIFTSSKSLKSSYKKNNVFKLKNVFCRLFIQPSKFEFEQCHSTDKLLKKIVIN